jgi:hypothetical protein
MRRPNCLVAVLLVAGSAGATGCGSDSASAPPAGGDTGGATTGGTGGDTVVGGTGGGVFTGGTGGALLTGGTGGAIVTGGTGGAIVTGGTGGVIVTGGTGGAIITGGTGGIVTTGGTGGVVTTGGTGGVVTTGGTGGAVVTGGTGGTSGGAGMTGLHVSGTSIVDGSGQPVMLRGVNRSGTEFKCRDNPASVFDGPSDDVSLAAMQTWGINAVRIPLNEQCWLGINGYPASPLTAADYRQSIIDYVGRVTARGMAAIVELHLVAPGTTQSYSYLWTMPDADHAPTFWADLAPRFATNTAVVYELFNEPWPDNNQNTATAWTCWRTGTGCGDVGYTPVGMQSLLDTVRASGAGNLVLAGGIQYSNRIDSWSLSDSQNNVAAAWHIYNYNSCNDTTCWSSQLGALRSGAGVPALVTEFGEDDGGNYFTPGLMQWLDSSSVGYLAWTWTVWNSNWDLITAYDGTPRNPYGTAIRDHLLALGL